METEQEWAKKEQLKVTSIAGELARARQEGYEAGYEKGFQDGLEATR